MSLDPQYILPYLKQIPLFSQLDEEESLDIVRTFSIETVKAGEILCKEDDPSHGMYVIERGRVKVEKNTMQGVPELLAELGTKDVVGEMSLLDGRPCSATVIALEDCSVYRVGLNEFTVLRANLRPAPYKVIRFLAQTLCERLRDMNKRIEDFYADPKKSLRDLKKRQEDIMAQWRSGAGGPGPQAHAPSASSPSMAETEKRTVQPLHVGSGAPDPDAVVEFLEQVPLLEELTEIELEVLAGILEHRSVKSGEMICTEGEPGETFFIIGAGSVVVKKNIEGAHAQELATLTAGALVGEISLIDRGPRSASCEAVADSLVLTVSRDEFDALFQANSPFALRFVERVAIDLSLRLRSSDQRFTDIFSRTGSTMEELRKRFLAIRSTLEGGDGVDRSSLMQMVGYRKVPTGGGMG